MKPSRSILKIPILLLLWTQTPALFAVKTNDVELGHSSVYDDTVHIRRNEAGQMTFQDSEITSPIALSSLNQGVSTHGGLTGLTADDHAQYLNDSRHQNSHSQEFNASLSIPLDPAGNSRLGDHVTDSDIHLPRDETVTISGDWRFTGTPAVWKGLNFSANGAAGDVLLNFESGAQDAQILWDASEDRFVINRALDVAGPIYGAVSDVRLRSETMHFPMDDWASNPTILDATGFHSQVLRGPANPNTDQRTTIGVVSLALSFQLGDYVNLGHVADPLLAANQPFSIAFWWKTNNDDTATARHLLSNYGSAQPCHFFWYTANGKVQVVFYTGPGNWINYNWNGGDDGQWHHYVMTRGGETLTVWRDAVLKGSDTKTSNALTLAGGNLYLARSGDGGNSAGCVDDLRFYNRVISEAEIAALYNQSAGTPSSARFVAELDGGLSLSRMALDGGFTDPTALLQIGEGAYCDGNTWVNVSAREAKTGIAAASAQAEWSKLDALSVVEFAYRKRNPNRGGWLDPQGNPVAPETETYRLLTSPKTPESFQNLLSQGYLPDHRKYVSDPQPRRRLGFLAEDLEKIDPRLSRGNGVAAMDVAAFNTAVLQEAKRRIEELEARIQAIETARE